MKDLIANIFELWGQCYFGDFPSTCTKLICMER